MAPPSPYELAEIEHRRSSIISSGTQSTSTAVNTSAPSVTSSKVKYRSYGGSSITSSARSESFTQDDRRNLAVASTTFLGDILPIDAWIGGESKKDKAREALNQANSMTTTVTTDINARTITRVSSDLQLYHMLTVSSPLFCRSGVQAPTFERNSKNVLRTTLSCTTSTSSLKYGLSMACPPNKQETTILQCSLN